MAWLRRKDSDPARDLSDGSGGARDDGTSLRLTPALDRRADALLSSITDELASSDTGVDFVYRSLDRLQERANADDVLVIVEDDALGRQAFRAGRRPIETDWARELVRSGAVGLHAVPEPIDEPVAASVVTLCTMALNLDIARHDALHDPLTGVLNRRAFDEVLASACAHTLRYGWRFALVVMDLDGFKVVNDRLGHAAGDATLRTVAHELRSRLRVGDVAARIGGDEFALVLPNVSDDLVPDLIARLTKALESSVADADVTVSSGCAVAPDDGTDASQLFRLADQRLYEVKGR